MGTTKRYRHQHAMEEKDLIMITFKEYLLVENSLVGLEANINRILQDAGNTPSREEEIYSVLSGGKEIDPQLVAQAIMDARQQKLQPKIDASRQANIKAGLIDREGNVIRKPIQ